MTSVEKTASTWIFELDRKDGYGSLHTDQDVMVLTCQRAIAGLWDIDGVMPTTQPSIPIAVCKDEDLVKYMRSLAVAISNDPTTDLEVKEFDT